MADNKKISAKDLPKTLTKDEKVISSMKAIQRAGFFAFVTAIIAILILVIRGGEANASTVVLLPFIALYLAYSGWKMNRLEGDASIVVMLVVNALIGLLLVAGILPALLIIFSVIALVKISAYRNWRKTATKGKA